MSKKSLPAIPKNVFLLSLVSFLNDIGGETIKKTIPLYLANVLGVKPSVIGLVEGIADSTPQLFQPIVGILSDKLKKRKPFIILGQGLRSLVLLLFFAVSWPHILLIRFLDRSGKGIANSPRDALITDSSNPRYVGRSFGLNRTFDNAGAVVGFLIAGGLVVIFGGSHAVMTQEMFQWLVVLAVVPLIIAFGIVLFGIHDTKASTTILGNVKPLGKNFWLLLVVCFIFTLGNSSDAFLILKAQQSGASLGLLFLFLALYSGVSSLSGYPLGKLSDLIGRKKLLLLGWLLYGGIYIFFSKVGSLAHMTLLFVLYGFYLGLTEGAVKAWVADIVPKESRATAFGIYNMVVGLTLLPASLLAGFFWQQWGLSAALQIDAVFAIVAALLLLIL